jgi:hypothetical protein
MSSLKALKQKKALIREINQMASRPPVPSRLNRPALSQKPVKRKTKMNQSQAGRLGGQAISPTAKGISNVLGQRTDIPLTQTFAGSESLGRFNGSVAFTETQFPINPGQAVTFPWLSQEAKLWEKYEFDKLEFEFRTTINEFSANALGRVILGVDFDASDSPPSTRSQAEISRPVSAQAPYINQRLALRKSDMHDVCKRHYVRPGNLPGASDIKMYDVGVLNFGTDGNINANEVGELWVHYSGTFHVQVLESTSTAPVNFQVALFESSAQQALASGTPLTLTVPTATANGLGAVNTAGAIVLPAGNYLLDGAVLGTAGTSLTVINAQWFKNAGAIASAVQSPTLAASSVAVVTSCPVNATPYFVSVNGTDSISLKITVTGTGGVNGSGWIRVVAV